MIKETFPVSFTIEKYSNTYLDLVEAKKENSLVLVFVKATDIQENKHQQTMRNQGGRKESLFCLLGET